MSLELLFKTKYKELVKYAAAFVGNDNAEDVVQNLYIRLHVKQYDYSMVEGTIFLILKRECFSYNDHLARKRKKIRLVGSAAILDYLQSEPQYNCILEKISMQYAVSLLKGLPKKRADAIGLFYLHGYSSPEIAKIIGNCAASTVRNNILHGMNTLRASLCKTKN